MTITMITEELEKDLNKKTVYNSVSTNTETITEDELRRIIDSCPFFRRLGGSETITRNHNKYGYLPTKLVSTSPDRNTKIIRTFKYN